MIFEYKYDKGVQKYDFYNEFLVKQSLSISVFRQSDTLRLINERQNTLQLLILTTEVNQKLYFCV